MSDENLFTLLSTKALCLIRNDAPHGHSHHDERLGDVAMDEMSKASLKIAELVFRANGSQAEHESS